MTWVVDIWSQILLVLEMSKNPVLRNFALLHFLPSPPKCTTPLCFPSAKRFVRGEEEKKKGRKNKNQEQKDLIRYLFFPFQFFKSEAVNELMLGNFLHMITAKLLIVHYFIYQIHNLHKSKLFKI